MRTLKLEYNGRQMMLIIFEDNSGVLQTTGMEGGMALSPAEVDAFLTKVVCM